MMPMADRQNRMLVPPELTKGRSMPLAGAQPLTTMRFMAACMQIISVKPKMQKRWNGSRVWTTSRYPTTPMTV